MNEETNITKVVNKHKQKLKLFNKFSELYSRHEKLIKDFINNIEKDKPQSNIDDATQENIKILLDDKQKQELRCKIADLIEINDNKYFKDENDSIWDSELNLVGVYSDNIVHFYKDKYDLTKLEKLAEKFSKLE